MAPRVVWAPQPGPQKALIDCPIGEIFFGGARGGGKTDAVLGKYGIKAETYGPGFNGLFFRRELPMLDDAVERSAQIYGPLGAKWNDQKKTWRFPGGGRLRFRPLERVQDAEKYQGQNVSDVCVEEAGNYPDPAPIDRLHGILRSADGVPTQMILTGNPGGPGHLWLKQRFVDPAPQGMRVLSRLLPSGEMHRYVFIPSKLQQNRKLIEADPRYIDRLYLVGSPELVKAWLDGDWNAIAGAFFTEFSIARHVVRPILLPQHWTRFRAMDWGSSTPFSIGWYAVADGTVPGIAAGALVKYREWYGSTGKPNEGLRLTAEEVAAGIADREKEGGDHPAYGVLDPSAFDRDNGPSIAERMGRKGVHWRPADNRRRPGWNEMMGRIRGEEGRPMLLLFSTCQATIRTIPALQHDPADAEDVHKAGEDHAGDETRYACMSRPYQSATPPAPEDITRSPTALEMIQRHLAQRRAAREE